MKSPCIGCPSQLVDKRHDPCRSCKAPWAYAEGLTGFDPDWTTMGRWAEDRGRKTVDGELKAVDGGRKTVDGEQKTVDREQKPREEAQVEIKKTCNICKEEKVASDDPEKTEFTKNKDVKDGFERFCRSCKAEKDRANRASRRAAKKAEEAATSPAHEPKADPQKIHDEPAVVTLHAVAVDPETSIVLDFTDYPDLLQKIKDIAREEFRTKEGQILWIISNLQLVEVPDAHS